MKGFPFDMRHPEFGEINLGAVTGAIIGGIGGLFALQAGPVFLARDLSLLFSTPILTLLNCVLSWLICGPTGWVIGGQLGPRLAAGFHWPKAEVVGGIVGGLIPITALAFWGFQMAQ